MVVDACPHLPVTIMKTWHYHSMEIMMMKPNQISSPAQVGNDEKEVEVSPRIPSIKRRLSLSSPCNTFRSSNNSLLENNDRDMYSEKGSFAIDGSPITDETGEVTVSTTSGNGGNVTAASSTTAMVRFTPAAA